MNNESNMSDQVLADNGPLIVVALYKFAPLEGLETLQTRLLEVGGEACVRGTLLIASEGVNGTLAGPRAGIDRFLDAISGQRGF